MAKDMKSYRLQANISRWLADLARRAAHLETRSMSSYVANLIMRDLKDKGLVDMHGRPVKSPHFYVGRQHTAGVADKEH